MVGAVFFDLDYCLCAGSEADAELFAPVFAAIRGANAGTLPAQVLQAALRACLYLPFDTVAQRYRFSAAMYRAGIDGFSGLEVTRPLRGYPDLDVLPALPRPRFLVTSGFPRLQRSKVDALGIRGCFDDMLVDRVGMRPRRGKRAVFADIVRRHGLHAPDVWVVGDDAESEIAAGNALGMVTVQIVRPGVVPCTTARHVVPDLRALQALLAAAVPQGARA